ncbi:MAG TPA: hypothetical protein VFO50_02355 [Candidatus Limnocylindrales bacterium]|nr:hypothetical protein [Candidatus Limnocylindrales bacterium]
MDGGAAEGAGEFAREGSAVALGVAAGRSEPGTAGGDPDSAG